jgi:hypothetical protein
MPRQNAPGVWCQFRGLGISGNYSDVKTHKTQDQRPKTQDLKPKHHKNPPSANYRRNLPELTPVPRITLVWVTKLFSSVPTKRPLAR